MKTLPDGLQSLVQISRLSSKGKKRSSMVLDCTLVVYRSRRPEEQKNKIQRD